MTIYAESRVMWVLRCDRNAGKVEIWRTITH
jgi:hypothetical protein